MKKFTLIILCFIAIAAMMSNRANAANDGDSDVMLTAVVQSTNDVSKIPVTIYLTNPSTEVASVTAVLEAPVAVSKFVYNTSEHAYSNTDRWNLTTSATFAAGTAAYGENGFYISIMDNKLTAFKGSEGPIITVYFDGSELADGNYTVKVLHTETYPSAHESNSEAKFSIRDGKVTGSNSGSTSVYRTVTYFVDGNFYATQQYKEGDNIVPIDVPVKYGYVFSGWSTIPNNMGAEDLIVTGTFTYGGYHGNEILTALVESTNDVSKIPITIYLTNPSTEVASVTAVLEAPVAVSKFVYNTSEYAYSNTDRWNLTTSATFAAGTAAYGENGFYISIMDNKLTAFKGSEGPVITVYFDGSELADGSYIVKMLHTETYPYSNESNGEATFTIRNGKVIGTNGGSTSTLATDISLDHATLSMNIGESQKLSASIIPSEALQDVTWTSSDTKVATVSQNGVVTAIAEGQTIIAATTTDGSNIKGYCIVSVYNYNSDGLCYRFEEDFWSGGRYAYVTRSANAKGDIIIPEYVEDQYGETCEVVGIDDGAFAGCTGITSITLSYYADFSNTAFTGCTGLKKIIVGDNVRYVRSEDNNCLVNNDATELFLGFDNTVIPNSVTNIRSYAFRGCTGLASIEIPNSVTTIYHSAFYGCTGLTSINIPESITTIPSYTFYGCTGLTSVTFSNSVTTIDNSAFYGCTGMTSIELPNSVTSIGNSAFKNCSSLASINIPASVTTFGNGIFEGCTSLPVQDGIRYADNYIVEIVDKDRTTYSIKEGTRVVNMEGCANMVSIDLPNSVTEINFKGCTNLASVTIPNSVTSIRDNAFQGCTGLVSVTVPNSVTRIGNYAFQGCTGLTSIDIPGLVTSIGWYAFDGCTGLSSISVKESNSIYDSRDNCNCIIETNSNSIILGCKSSIIPNSVTRIGRYAFRSCSLTSLEIPNSVTSIEEGAFQGCTGLTSITIPASVTHIWGDAFEGCTNLTSIESMVEDPDSLELGTHDTYMYLPAGFNFANIDLIVPAGTAEKYRTAQHYWGGFWITEPHWKDCRSITERTVNSDILYEVIDENNVAVSGLANKQAVEVEIPSTVVYGGKEYAVSEIAGSAFSGCTGLTSIEIPNSVTSIGEYAFTSCSDLTSVTIPESVTNIGNGAFNRCSGLTSVSIPKSVTNIGYNAFGYCTGLTSISVDKDNPVYDSREDCNCIIETATNTLVRGCKNSVIPNSVTSIGSTAFRGCSDLTAINMPNSIFNIGDYAFEGCAGLTSIDIPSSLTSIGWQAFNGCTGLTRVNITDLTAWCNIYFNYVYPDSNPLYLAHHLYLNGEEITGHLVIPESVNTIYSYAFAGCTGLTSVTIPNSVTNIGASAFMECTEMTSIHIPASVTYIDGQSFYRCAKISSMEVMREEPCELGYEDYMMGQYYYSPALDDYGSVDLIVPFGCAEKYKNATYWKDFRSIREKVVDPDFSYVIDESNAAVYGTNDKEATEVEIPSAVENDGKVYPVTQIAANAFANYENLKQAFIPDDVTTVGDAAFEDCNSLEYVVLPAKMEEIGDKAFEGCTSITEIRTLSTEPPTISENTFSEETLMNATLYVPIGYAVVYENAPYWGRFAYISEKDMSDDVTSISDVSADSQATVVGIYTPSGSRLNADSVGGLGKGIYIFRYNDGKSEKVVVK